MDGRKLTKIVPLINIKYQTTSALRGKRGLPISSWER